MGTTRDWIKVLLSGGFWGGLMLLFGVFERKHTRIKPALLVLIYLIGGLAFGFFVTFDLRQAFRWPLILVSVPVLVAVAGVGVVSRIYPTKPSRQN